MKLSLNLLKKFTPIDKSAQEIADRITLSLTEVENVVRISNPPEDTILEIENKALTHRPDCFSHVGIAREIAAYFNVVCNDPLPELTNKTVVPARLDSARQAISRLELSISIDDKELCARYCAVVLTNIKVGPSPGFIRETLEQVGIRSINNVVDITNFVMIELGQPLHAFDYDRVEGHEIKVRRAVDGEKIITLDGKERELTTDMLVIADSSKPIGIAGVMGGTHTEVGNETKTIILEAATFEAKNIRQTSKTLNLRTDAATRFEKNLDSNLPYPALIRAIELLQEHAGAKVASEIVDIHHSLTTTKILTVSAEWINKFLGTGFKSEEMADLLKRFGFHVETNGDKIKVTIPTYRRDLTMDADIAEEIARVYGYDNIPVSLPSQTDFTPTTNRGWHTRTYIKTLMMGMGYTELSTPPFIGDSLLEKSNLKNHEHLTLTNPLTVEQKYMRRSLVPSLLHAITANQARYSHFKLFELNTLYVPQGENQPLEPLYLTGVTIGQSYREVKGAAEELFDRLGIREYSFKPYPADCGIYDALFHGARTAQIYIKDKPMGILGHVHPEVLDKFGIQEDVISFDIHVMTLIENTLIDTEYKPIPEYPPVIEDITIALSDDHALGDSIEKIKKSSSLINNVELTDTFEDKHTFRITFLHPERTLTGKEVGEIKEKILEHIL